MLMPLNWVISAAAAALVHEACHIFAVLLLGGKIRGFSVSVTGCRIETAPLGTMKRIVCILAGPAGSILLFAVRRSFPRIAVCGLIQGIYNLLPVMPLDGGKILKELLDRIFPEKAEKWMHGIQILTGIVVILSGMLAGIQFRMNVLSIIFCLFVHIGIRCRKIPCKENRIGLQWY